MDGECIWKQNDPWTYGNGTYDTCKDGMWSFTEGDVKDNRVEYCPYCGKRIKVVLFEEPKEGVTAHADQLRM